ncbi:hypothetical protein T03_14777 [Trichinella britovi]|uniref:Uncharacterized protein n=1 Tax=Trichinella britovi TaxID=45882 RepID=A0A0V1CBJ9_TRIBR|nr:hypothetical protein T03_14777 [Trichinella britovi]
MRMSKPGKEEACGILETVVHGRTIAIQSSTAVQAIGMTGKKHIPLVTTSTRSSYRSCVTSLKERLDPLSNAAVYCDELENRKRRAKDSWSDIGRDIRHLMSLDWINFSTLDRPELVLLVKQRNPKNIEEAVRAALEVESFMIRPGPGLLIGTSSQTPYNADPAKNETSADISRLTSCLERMQLRLEDIEQRMQAFQPKQRDRRGDYVTERAANEQQPERRTCYRCGRDGGDAITTRKDPYHGSDLMAVVSKIDGCPTNILIDTGSAVTLVQSDQQSSIYLSSGHCVESCAASTFWLRFPSTFRLHAGHSRRGAANRWEKSSVGGGDHSQETTSADKCHGPWLLERRPKGKLPVAIARAVVHPREGCVPVQLLNPSADRVTIHRGNVVATTEAVDPLPLGRPPKTHTAILN